MKHIVIVDIPDFIGILLKGDKKLAYVHVTISYFSRWSMNLTGCSCERLITCVVCLLMIYILINIWPLVQNIS